MTTISNFVLYPQHRAVAIYRLSRWCHTHKLKVVGRILWNINITLNGFEISPYADIGPGLVIQHTTGTVVGKGVTAGSNLTLYQNVTIGAKGDPETRGAYPIIGDNVTLFPGSVVVGPIRIGNGVQVGANSVVLQDIPDGAVVAGVPAKIIKQNSKAEPEKEMERIPVPS
jgi:serine O-acetyltransferase